MRQRNLPHSPMTDCLPSTSFKESHSSEQAFADSPGELTTSRKLGWQQTLAEEPRQLFSHYSITSWQAGCITPIGIAPSTGRPGDHQETARFSYHLDISKDFKCYLVRTQDSFLRSPSAPCLLHHRKFVCPVPKPSSDTNKPQSEKNLITEVTIAESS